LELLGQNTGKRFNPKHRLVETVEMKKEMARARFPRFEGRCLEDAPPQRILGRADLEIDIHRLMGRIVRKAADPIMFSLQLGRFADARLAKQCQCPVSLKIGNRPQHVSPEMIADRISQKTTVREIEHAGLRNPEALPVISNDAILDRNGHVSCWRPLKYGGGNWIAISATITEQSRTIRGQSSTSRPAWLRLRRAAPGLGARKPAARPPHRQTIEP
jgi:hypothetical protein